MLKLELGDKQYHTEIKYIICDNIYAIKYMLITMISSWHFYSIWINLPVYHISEVKRDNIQSVSKEPTRKTKMKLNFRYPPKLRKLLKKKKVRTHYTERVICENKR